MKDWPPFDPRTSDGCTGVRQIARHCCVAHDEAYWAGRSWWDKLRADLGLARCIWRHGWRECRTAREPWATLPVWLALGIIRGLGVALLAWRPFWSKPHKAGLTWREKIGWR